jgi:hypothetical protein
MEILGFPRTTELNKFVVELQITESSESSKVNSFNFIWGEQIETDSYTHLAKYLTTELGLNAQVVGNGQNISHKSLINVNIAERRKQLTISDGLITSSQGEFVIDCFNLVGNTDIVILKKNASNKFISRTGVLFAIEVKTVSAMSTVPLLNCCLREAFLQLVGLNVYNTDSSPSVILTNLNKLHFVLYIDWPVNNDPNIEEVKYFFHILRAKTLHVAIKYAENLSKTRKCGTREFARSCSPSSNRPKMLAVKEEEEEEEEEDLLVAYVGKMKLDLVSNCEIKNPFILSIS